MHEASTRYCTSRPRRPGHFTARIHLNVPHGIARLATSEGSTPSLHFSTGVRERAGFWRRATSATARCLRVP